MSKSSFWEFLLAFKDKWFTAMSGPLTVPFGLLALYVEQNVIRVLFGILAICCAVFSAYWVWRKERQDVGRLQNVLAEEISKYEGPEVILDYDWEERRGDRRDKGLTLLNRGCADAFDIKIQDIARGTYVASFEEVPMILKDRDHIIKANVEQEIGISALFRHDFQSVLASGWNDQKVLSVLFPVQISYRDIHGVAFETRCEIEYHYIRKTGKTKLKSCGRAASA